MIEERRTSREHHETPGTPRREALGKIGRYAAYTAPALMALTLPGEAAAANGWGIGRGRGRGKGKGGGKGRPVPHVSGG